MNAFSNQQLGGTARPVALQVRADLAVSKQQYQGTAYWVVKEPLGSHYYRFKDEEYAIVQMLDGRTSLDQMCEQFELQFAPQTIKRSDIHRFIGQLYRAGLVVSNAPGQGRQLLDRAREQSRKLWISRLSNPLAIKLPAFDPHWLLTRLYPHVRVGFTPAGLTAGFLLILSALLLVTVRFGDVQSHIGDLRQVFSIGNWGWLLMGLVVTRSLHELGHALTARHFGCECREMGVMLLVFTPCLYTNVTDAWILPNRRHRMAVSAAGIYVELLIASLAAFVWWFSEPGALKTLCLQLMLLCSVNTLIFNGNPLMRFDGYYVLSDWLEIPNLRQKAQQLVQRFLLRVALGVESPIDTTLPRRQRLLFVAYSIAAVLYSWLVTFSVLFLLNRLFEPYGLQIVGQGLALVALFGLLIQPAWRLGQTFAIPGRAHQIKPANVIASAVLLALFLVTVFTIPLPQSIVVPVVLECPATFSLATRIAGRLDDVRVTTGDEVVAGQVIGRLDNADLTRRIDQLLHERQARSLLRNDAGFDLGTETNPELAVLDRRIAELEAAAQLLELQAPVSGTVLDAETAGEAGSPLDPANRGCLLQENSVVCRIAHTAELHAVLWIPQDQIELIRAGQPVTVSLAALPDLPISGQLHDVSEVSATADRPAAADSLSGTPSAYRAVARRRLWESCGNQTFTQTPTFGFSG